MNFDDEKYLNEDGTVTMVVYPSNWFAYGISPDTYQTYTLDYEDDLTLEHYSEEVGVDIKYDDLEWNYDHSGIVRSISEILMEWIVERLMAYGLESISNTKVVDTWSPKAYNFQTDGFGFEFTCDPEELRELTEEFDLDDWAHEYYRSRDGFMSYVTSRIDRPSWRASYDGDFRTEFLMWKNDDKYQSGKESAFYYVNEQMYEVYMEHVTVTPGPEVFTVGTDAVIINELDEEVTSTAGRGWKSENEEEFYPDLLTYHRESTKLVSVVVEEVSPLQDALVTL